MRFLSVTYGNQRLYVDMYPKSYVFVYRTCAFCVHTDLTSEEPLIHKSAGLILSLTRQPLVVPSLSLKGRYYIIAMKGACFLETLLVLVTASCCAAFRHFSIPKLYSRRPFKPSPILTKFSTTSTSLSLGENLERDDLRNIAIIGKQGECFPNI